MRILIVTAALLLAPAALGLGTLAGQSDPEQAALETVRAFHTALAAGDSAAALSLLAPDVVIFESGGVEASRDEYRAHHLPADIEFSRSVSREITSERVGYAGDVAWVLTEARSTGTFRERQIDARGVGTMLLRRAPDGWRIVHIHWSSRQVRGGS